MNSKICIGIIVLLVTSSFWTGWAEDYAEAGPSGTIALPFFDDFENIANGDYPDENGWQTMYSGKSGYVSNSQSYSGSKSFRLDSRQNWARTEYVTIETPAKLEYEAKVYLKESNKAAKVGFSIARANYNPKFNSVGFSKNGDIYFTGIDNTNLRSYSTQKWYHIKAQLDFTTETADVYIDGNLEGDNLKIYPREFYHPRWGNVKLNKFSICSSNYPSGSHNVVYFDDVGLRGESLIEYKWQSVLLPDINNPDLNIRYDIFVQSYEVPDSPETTVFPLYPPDENLEPVHIIIKDSEGNIISEEETVRQVLALSRNAALYRKWAADISDPIPVLDKLGGFTVVSETPQKCWGIWPLEICYAGKTDTSFGYSYPGYLSVPDDYRGIEGSSRIVDWDVLDYVVSMSTPFGDIDYFHPVGIRNNLQRKEVYTQILLHMIIQDGVKNIENNVIDDFLTCLNVVREGTDLASLALKLGDIIDAVNAVDHALKAAKFAEEWKRMSLTAEEMLKISSGFAANNFHAWYTAIYGPVKTAPRVFTLASKISVVLDVLSLAIHTAEFVGEVIHFAFQIAAMTFHGEEILNTICDTIGELPTYAVDSALLNAIEDIKIGLGGWTQLLTQAVSDMVDSGTEMALDSLQIALGAAAVVATGTIAGAPAGAVLILVDAAISVVRIIYGFIKDKLEREELQQAVVLMSTLDRVWWDKPLSSQVNQLLTPGPVSQEQLHRIGWLISTKLYIGAFVGERLLEENSDFLDQVGIWLGDTELASHQNSQREFAEQMGNIIIGNSDYMNDNNLKQVTGRPHLQGEYVGFAPAGAVEYLISKTLPIAKSDITLKVEVCSPGVIGIIDPAQRRIGTFYYDGIRQDLNEIAGATYSKLEPVHIEILNPIPGSYQILLHGT
ncbi:MAG: hypothetical protein ACP5EQ_07750, partial [Candidatus Cloacimonadia bacterium]